MAEASFNDWQEPDRRGLVVDDDFSWSDAPLPPRRRITGSNSAGRPAAGRRSSARAFSGTVVIERGSTDERGSSDWGGTDDVYASDVYSGERSPGYDEIRGYDDWSQEPDAAYREPAKAQVPARDSRELVAYQEMPASYADAGSGRHTVVITGRGSERYNPDSRRRRDSELAFYQRASFRPDSVAMWAVLLGIALVLGSITH